ncbi:g10619 [Coccomyxa elongata]
MSAFWPPGRPPRASSLSRSSSPAKPSRTRCLRSFEMDAMLAFLACAFSFSRSACTCFEYFFASRCFRLATSKLTSSTKQRQTFSAWYMLFGFIFCFMLLPHVQKQTALALDRDDAAICFGVLVNNIHGHGTS